MPNEFAGEKERAKEVFDLVEEKKPVMSPEDKKVFRMQLNLLILFLIFLILIVLAFLVMMK